MMDKAQLARVLDPDAFAEGDALLSVAIERQTRREYAEFHAANLIGAGYTVTKR